MLIVRQKNIAEASLVHNIFNLPMFSRVLHVILAIPTGSMGKYQVMRTFFKIGIINPIDSCKVYQKPICVDEFHAQASAVLSDDDKSMQWETLFDQHILKDLSCKLFKATAFLYEPATTITKFNNGEIKLVL